MNNTQTTKTILITGASRGIGKALKVELETRSDYRILSPSRQELNLSEERSIEKYFRNVPSIDILINNAGINILNAIEEIEAETIHTMLAVNLVAPLKLIQCVVPGMKQKNFGRIVNMSSIWGIRSKEFRTLYSTVKFGINGMTRALARELGPHNILVNAVCPGYVNTEMTKQNVPLEEQELIKQTIPLKRFAEPEEIAKLLAFLISEQNTYITGQTIIIDGGFTS